MNRLQVGPDEDLGVVVWIGGHQPASSLAASAAPMSALSKLSRL